MLARGSSATTDILPGQVRSYAAQGAPSAWASRRPAPWRSACWHRGPGQLVRRAMLRMRRCTRVNLAGWLALACVAAADAAVGG